MANSVFKAFTGHCPIIVVNRALMNIIKSCFFFLCIDFTINPLNPIVHFWLHHTAHCAEKIVSARLRAGSASAERVGQGEVGGVTGRVLCTWWLLGLALKRPWLVPGGQPHALTAWTGLENTTLTLQRAGFLQERLLGL